MWGRAGGNRSGSDSGHKIPTPGGRGVPTLGPCRFRLQATRLGLQEEGVVPTLGRACTSDSSPPYACSCTSAVFRPLLGWVGVWVCGSGRRALGGGGGHPGMTGGGLRWGPLEGLAGGSRQPHLQPWAKQVAPSPGDCTHIPPT